MIDHWNITETAEFIVVYHVQADRVSTAAYQSAWPTMGVKPRRLLINVLLANLRPMIVRAGRFLPMNLHTFVMVCIYNCNYSFYYTII